MNLILRASSFSRHAMLFGKIHVEVVEPKLKVLENVFVSGASDSGLVDHFLLMSVIEYFCELES